MAQIEKTVKVEVDIQDAAMIFTNASDEEQSKFFNIVAEIVKQWKIPFCFQVASIEHNKILTPEAKQVIKELYEGIKY